MAIWLAGMNGIQNSANQANRLTYDFLLFFPVNLIRSCLVGLSKKTNNSDLLSYTCRTFWLLLVVMITVEVQI